MEFITPNIIATINEYVAKNKEVWLYEYHKKK